MRPQHITAENLTIGYGRNLDSKGFNEAAAYHCGKRRNGPGDPLRTASFNEAAAYHCGKPGYSRSRALRLVRFNEAAAYHCGKRVGPVSPMRRQQASMRPQHITAENWSGSRG